MERVTALELKSVHITTVLPIHACVVCVTDVELVEAIQRSV